jgi:hypothetical protein
MEPWQHGIVEAHLLSGAAHSMKARAAMIAGMFMSVPMDAFTALASEFYGLCSEFRERRRD